MLWDIVKYFELSPKTAEKTVRILYDNGCIFYKTIGKVSIKR
jgi:hypothetical protein